ncbi:MAG TPA: aminodeoxychorismate synthase component I [Kiritimatiellia bacterium]|nr:aminodeoxychorismate synthase component I [Kiritimatiellia bacterium]HRZ11872.1 aminodeoxychorismate synthase component I [Kiritimatiellia bacterium]HSA17322.1 aminodeoxychorismate synthase component I [Kiritimatiellia bacterium]
MIEAWHHSFSRTGGWDVRLADPCEVQSADELPDVLPLVRRAEAAAREGKWVTLLLSYESAPAFDAALVTREPGAFPLAWMAVFEKIRGSGPPPAEGAAPAPWQPLVSRDEYESAIRRIREYIAAGDTYQVNYTFPLRAAFPGDGAAWFLRQGPAQGAPWSVFVDTGRFQVLSFSPELFFEWTADRLVCRPMKGTAQRGLWFEDDEARRRALSESRKDRAENLMITDMVRNDLGRIAEVGSVKTARLFEIERYPTLFQMISEIEARPRPGIRLEDVLRALFPGASVTGAPKVRTMQIIRELEPQRRGLYTGAVGLLRPGGAAQFSIPIRTVVADRAAGEAVFHAGGGVTWDSTAEGEYDECLLKTAFLHESPRPFSLLETLRLEDGEYYLLERHLRRLRQSAVYFELPVDESCVRTRLAQLAADHRAGVWRARLRLDARGEIEIEAQPLIPDEEPWRVALADEPVNSRDPFLYHKTTRREIYDRRLAAHPGCRDVILWNERGEITESCLANVSAVIGGREYTPPVGCGLLPGTLRGEWLESGRLAERVIRIEEWRQAEAVHLFNSVRGRIRIEPSHG